MVTCILYTVFISTSQAVLYDLLSREWTPSRATDVDQGTEGRHSAGADERVFHSRRYG